MPESKTHFTREPYMGRGACQWDRNQILKVSTDINEVDCRSCLSAIIPAKYRSFTTDELRARALKFNQ